MSPLKNAVFPASILCCAFVLLAQDTPPAAPTPPDAAAPAPAPATKHWTFTAGFDAYSEFNTDRPPDGLNELRNFDLSSGSAHLNATSLGVEFKSDYFGAHFDSGYGDMFKTMAATDAWKGPNQYVMQGYVSVLPWNKSGPQFDFGKFYTSLGAEIPDTLSNFNYSRSLAFTLGTPYYHFGLRTSLPLSKSFTAGLQLVEGCNDVTDRNKGRAGIVTSALTHSKWGWNQAFMSGSETVPALESAIPAYRNVIDEVVTIAPQYQLRAYFEALYGREHRNNFSPDNWYGFAVAMRWQASRKLSFSPRVEYFGDPTGFNSGTPQHLHEFTATADYQIHSLLTVRSEYRRDMSDRMVFDSDTGLRSSQQTFLVGLIAVWKAER